jgi:chaperone required for assembly of F1-ATPase
MSKWKKKRFWKVVSIKPIDGLDGYQISLDDKILNTPSKNPFVLPTSEMASLVASEWQSINDEIKPQEMPYTRFVNSSIDKIKPQLKDIRKLLLEYGDCDLICYRADSPQALISRQELAWDGAIEWAEKELNVILKVFKGVVYCPQPTKSILELEKHVFELSIFQLCALHELVTISGSLILSLAVIKEFLCERTAWEASQVEEKWQVDHWGSDMDAQKATDEKRNSFYQAVQFFKVS